MESGAIDMKYVVRDEEFTGVYFLAHGVYRVFPTSECWGNSDMYVLGHPTRRNVSCICGLNIIRVTVYVVSTILEGLW